MLEADLLATNGNRLLDVLDDGVLTQADALTRFRRCDASRLAVVTGETVLLLVGERDIGIHIGRRARWEIDPDA